MRKVWITFLLVGLLMLLGACSSSSDENSDIKDTKNINPWDYVEDTSISTNPTLQGFASSASELGITIGIIGLVFSIFYMVIRISFTKNAQIKEEIKREAILKGLIGIMLFSIPFWLGLIKYVAELLV